MKDLVQIQESKVTTTSLKVAEVFGKEHKNVLRDIDNLINSLSNIEQKDELKFEPISYTDKYGRDKKAYNLNKDAFILLVMGYSGEKAINLKVAYINAFNQMETQLRALYSTTLSRDEIAMIFQLLTFFKYLSHCQEVEDKHRKTYIASRINTGKPIADLTKEFYVMRNSLLNIGNVKQLKQKYAQYCFHHPNIRYSPNASKFVMVFTMDKYEPIRHAIADFLKLEFHPDGYTLKISGEAKDFAKRGNLAIERANETNLFREKEQDLIDMHQLKIMAGQLLQVQA